ncbi:sacsin N-terminal ATP-binding-like domain-containing protein [Agrococcus citreus]|uniref:sacsin N-terminal ATP-binding-like domain-containing protein n=1 Tax=Agrococcus citreus TaxID=84643 RepID=UPI0031DAC1C0
MREQTRVCLDVYAKDPSRITQDANNERRISQGGYSSRQLEELVQNATDAAKHNGSRVEVVLTKSTLYVANDGEPFTAEGVRSILASDISAKDDERIGKFGIGFKSLLAVSERPLVVSRTVAFAFDAGWAAETLRSEGYDLPQYPIMRLARVVSAAAEGAADPVLAQLMEWAATVVVVPLNVPVDEISKRLYDFSPQFVLFSPHISRAVLRNEAGSDPTARPGRSGRPATRSIRQESVREGIALLHVDGQEPQPWAIARLSHEPTPQALRDGGHIAARQKVELQYALPMQSSPGLGTFWAYFPTQFQSTLSGLINAAWKLSDDRTGLLEGPFNRELLGRLPELVAEAIGRFSGFHSPAAVIDALPARGDEARNWADRDINEPIYKRLRTAPSIPDGASALRLPRDLQWVGDATDAWLQNWAALPNAPTAEWVHRDVYRTPERRSKVERLMRPAGLRRDGTNLVGLDVWLQALVARPTASQAAAAIGLAAEIMADATGIHDPKTRTAVVTAIKRARIVLLEDGSLAAPERGRVFVRVEGEAADDVSYVNADLANYPGIREQLARLGVVVMDRSGELHASIAKIKGRGGNTPDNWQRVWTVLRDIPADTAVRILREDLGEPLVTLVCVRNADRQFVPLSKVFLAGVVIPADGSRDRAFLIDPNFHQNDADLLRRLGAVDAPVWRHDAPRETWLDQFEQMGFDEFTDKQTGAKPDRTRLQISGSAPPWPLEQMRFMSDAARAAITEHVLRHGLGEDWQVRHQTNNSYGRAFVASPETWLLRRYGLLKTAFGLLSASRVVRSGDMVDPAVLPAVEVSDAVAAALSIKDDPAEYVSSDWMKLKAIADTWTRGDVDDQRRAAFYAWLPGQIRPDEIVVRVGRATQSVPLGNVGIAIDEATYESMLEAQVPALLVPDADDAQRFIELWGMPLGTDLLQEEVVTEPSGEAIYATDAFPPLKLWLKAEDFDLRLQPAARIVKMMATPRGQVAKPISVRREGDTIFVTAEEPTRRLAQISEALSLGLQPADLAGILDQMAATATDERRVRIKRAADHDDRLLAAVGVDPLRRAIPAQALEILEARPGGVSEREIAGLARAVHGVGILRHLRAALDEQGLQPPKEWAGRRVTRQWVNSLGFPADWAGFPGGSRPAVEIIEGPAVLGELHGYQRFVTDRIKALLRGVGEDRGMVSLPTGAGKTRVTVQALTNALKDGDLSTDAPLVWIAQTDELCEQAADSWSYVWRAIGPGIPMRLGRLWGDNEVPEEPGSFQLIITTTSKLHSITTRPSDEYEWLRSPSAVVIDEAHASIASTYTEILGWLGRATRGRDKTERRPLIGLTATPFRGVDSEEATDRLVNRFDSNRLDRGAFSKEDPYKELQEMGVLARVRHESLDGVDVQFTPVELAEVERLKTLPSSVAETLGGDAARTLRIVDSIEARPDDWTILAFAPSVESSRVLAALLTQRGVSAVSISAETEPAARRHYIEEFKAGRIRVLTNYNVLAQGFDAPKAQAVYVTRPTFSPVVYQQMIGRGLRGERNGGTDEVLIVNVKDNFINYGELLAFNKFEHLWTKD